MAERRSSLSATVALIVSLVTLIFVAPGPGRAAPSGCEGSIRDPASFSVLFDELVAAGEDEIVLDPECDYRVASTATAEVRGKQIRIDGNGATLRGVADPLLHVAAGGVLAVDNTVVVQEDNARAIQNDGVLRITTSTISVDETGWGGLENNGYARITGSTFADNVWDGPGGAIRNHREATLIVEDSTFSANESDVEGGAIANYGRLKLANATLWANSAVDGTSLVSPAGTATVTNTIVAGNRRGPVCSSPLAPGGSGNLVDRRNHGGCGPGFETVDRLRLGPLENGGGLTKTHAPSTGSPAVDGGDNAVCTDADQRGLERPHTERNRCDVGAVEILREAFPDPNVAPAARDAAQAIEANASPIQLDLDDLASDEETRDEDLAYEIARAPEKGRARLSGSTVTYQVDAGAYGADSLTYRVTDRVEADCSPAADCVALSAVGTIAITIAPPPSPPVPNPIPPNPVPPFGPIESRTEIPDPELSPTSSPSSSPAPGAADLSIGEVTLELVPGGSAADWEGDPLYAAGEEPIVVVQNEVSGDMLHVLATVVNKGGLASTPTSMRVEAADWEGERIALPGISAGSETHVDESIPAPADVTDETKFTVTVDPVDGEGDAANNSSPELVALRADDGGSTKVVVIVVVAVVAAAVVGATSFLRPRRARSRRPRRNHRRNPLAAANFNGLPELVDTYLGGEPSAPLWSAGAATERLREELADDDLTAPLISTVYWRALIGTDTFRRLLEKNGASRAAVERPEVMIVTHAGGTRHDLVLLDPDFSLSEPSSTIVEATPEDVSQAWQAILSASGFKRGARLPGTKLTMRSLTALLREVCGAGTFGLVVAPKPEIVLAHCPSPAWPVGAEGNEPTSSVGVAAVDADGRVGVTVAYHAVRGHEKVMVNGRPGTVISSDPISDSSFVEVALDDVGAVRGAKGPLSGLSPRQMEVVEFDGMRSGKTTTRVVGWDPTILTMESYIQNKIVTEPVTMPGDSGAALIDGDGHILGFAFYTTGLNAQPAHSGWIWADSVHRAHNLRLLGALASAAR